jgi:hypothetical protein
MMSIWHVLILMGAGVSLALICVIVGGWLVFKSKAAPGEGFLKEPKGDVFSMTDGLDNEEFPGGSSKAEQSALKKNEIFRKLFGGGKDQ